MEISRLVGKQESDISDRRICASAAAPKTCSIERVLRKTGRFQKWLQAKRLTPDLVQVSVLVTGVRWGGGVYSHLTSQGGGRGVVIYRKWDQTRPQNSGSWEDSDLTGSVVGTLPIVILHARRCDPQQPFGKRFLAATSGLKIRRDDPHQPSLRPSQGT